MAFERRLARRSTLCFLRQLVATTDDYVYTTCASTRRTISTIASRAGPNATKTSHKRHEASQKWTIGTPNVPTRDEAIETALKIFPSSGVELFKPSPPPGESLRALQRQADVASGRASGELAVDRPENHGNIRLWAEMLQHRQRVDGFEGVLDVWRGMRRRNIDLPIRGSEADSMWTTFIQSSIRWPREKRHDKLLETIVDHARDLYPQYGLYAGLHTCIIGQWVRLRPASAKYWHETLCKEFHIARIDWHALAADFAHSTGAYEARMTFKFMYGRSQERSLYGYFVPRIHKQKGEDEALRWHRLLLKHGDGPDQETFADPVIQRLFELDGDVSLPMRHRNKDHGAAPAISRDRPRFPPLTRATMSTLVGDVHGIKPKDVSDSFVAKMFATYAFSIDLVISGLGFFGIDNLGPLAVREMALKAGTFIEFGKKLEDLKTCGIGMETSVYGRLMHKITRQGSSQLYETLIASDQHPESFGDAPTQELLLASYLQAEDWTMAHITLMALSLTGQAEHGRAWNRILQQYIMKRDYLSISRTAEQMQTSGMPFSKRTLTFMHRYVLPLRRSSKGPSQAPEARTLNPLQFTTNAYMFAATKGVYVNPSLWIENLKRYGLMHKWTELEHLILWLADWYSTPAQQHRWRRLKMPEVLRCVFDRQMREAIVTWGFRHASRDKMLQSREDNQESTAFEPWARGLALLRKLCHYDIQTTPAVARDAFLTRMWILFGPAYSTKAMNVEAKRNNRLTLAHYIRHANEVWEGELFPNLDQSLLEIQNHSKLLVFLFGSRHRVSKQRQENANVLEYARFLAQRHAHNLPSRRNGLARRKIWYNSTFRILPSSKPTPRIEENRRGQLRH